MALGLSQTALAERVGVSFQQVQKYESGRNRISASPCTGRRRRWVRRSRPSSPRRRTARTTATCP
ncbi:helix-turn-helix transcriptional regulator [uncultured Brevundimonas sp.]|uniref:helix-turn-helix domain-containing protein n=1 Tax=uncultured Brevundimonas sp. TaxID=213418 RepID=UPI0025D6E6BA|nr:helix-turn-helix transcriptional regulator [uncultured Brevundimonas sp.]